MNAQQRTGSSLPTVHGSLQPSVVRRLSSVFRHSMLGVGRWALGVCFSPRLVFRRLSLVHSLQSTTSPRCGASGHLASDVAVYSLRSGFTLIELLVVIVVIAILMGITLPVSKYAIYRAKAARQEVMLAKIRSALDDYRATYGEYPITPDTKGVLTTRAETSKHYWDNVIPDLDTVSNCPLPNVNLSTNTIEGVFVDGALYKVDYCLTFPLMLRQEREGKHPFMQFDKVSVLYVVYKFDTVTDEIVYHGKRKTKSGAMVDAKLLYAKGRPVDRAKAIDPMSGRQWKYECYNGNSYTITTNSF